MTTSFEFGNDGPESRALAELDTFLGNPGLDELAALFDTIVLPGDENYRLEVLRDIAERNWDFRKGAERQAVGWDNELLDQEGSKQWKTIFGAADKLGLVESSTPVNKNPDYLVILGGANKAPLDRLRYALGIEEDDEGNLVFGDNRPVGSVGKALVYLGSSRPLNVKADEPEKVKEYAPNAQAEFDLGCAAFETLPDAWKVDGGSQIRNDGNVYAWREYAFSMGGETRTGYVLNTPYDMFDPNAENKTRRANTYDNYNYFAEWVGLADEPSASVVAVTTGFYTAAQHLPGVQELTLPYGTHVETIGHDAAYSGAVRKPAQLLQETKAAIDAAVRLHTAIER
jgi:hypothetical protein